MPSSPPTAGPVLVTGATSLIGRCLPARMAGADLWGVGRGGGAEGYERWVAWNLGAGLPSPSMGEGPEMGVAAHRLTSERGKRRPSPPTSVTPSPPSAALPPSRGKGVVAHLAPIWLLPPVLPELLAQGWTRVVAVSSTSRWTKAQSSDPAERGVARRLAEAEAEVARLCEAAGATWTVLRPTLVYAEGRDRNVSRLAGLARRFGVLPLSGRGEGLRQPVHADDLAAAVIAALASPAAANRAYDLPGGETLTYADMCRRVFAGLGRPPRLLHAPPWLWRAGLALASPLLPGAGAAMGERMSADLVFDPGPAQRDLGWNPRPFRPDFRSALERPDPPHRRWEGGPEGRRGRA